MKPTKDGKALLYHLIGYDIVGIAFVKLLALSYHVVVLSPQYGENTTSFQLFRCRTLWLRYFIGSPFGPQESTNHFLWHSHFLKTFAGDSNDKKISSAFALNYMKQHINLLLSPNQRKTEKGRTHTI